MEETRTTKFASRSSYSEIIICIGSALSRIKYLGGVGLVTQRGYGHGHIL
jgi:hypothetical protein